MSLLAAALSISAYIVFPLPFTPIVISAQTIVVNLIGLTLKPKQAFCTLMLYLMLGLFGLPVFSGGTAGPAKLFGPTGGFYFGFLFAVAVISALKGNGSEFWRYAVATIAAGLPIQHLFAIMFFCFYNGFQLLPAFLSVSLPFIPVDIAKCLLSAFIGTSVNKTLRRA